MIKILLIETATEVCSAAIAVDGAVVALVEAPESLQHAALLTLQIDQCVRESGIPLSQLDAVAVSRGPGSYTSLRVGISVAKGICYALDKPLITVDTLGALARAGLEASGHEAGAAGNSVYLLPMIDARRSEVWTGIYDARFHALALAQPLILENNSFVNFLAVHLSGPEQRTFILSGNGIQKVSNVTFPENTVWSPIKKCSAQYLSSPAFELFQNADFQDVAYFEPVYMKPPNITVSNKSAWHEKQ